MMKFKFLLLSVLLLASFSAYADPTFMGRPTQVQTVVPSKCTLVSGGGLAFGTYSSLSTHLTAPRDVQTSITLRCTQGTAGARLLLGAGQGTNARCTGIPVRRMGSTLIYEIYQDSARTTHWGCDDSNSRSLNTFTSSTTLLTVSAYGRIPAGQNPTRGSFSDTVIVSVVL